MRTVFWEDNRLKMIDQRRLPGSLEVAAFTRHEDVAAAIQNMVVRGAPAIGAAAAFALALAARQSAGTTVPEVVEDLNVAARLLESSRPTAHNLKWATERILRRAQDTADDPESLRHHVLAEAQQLADEDVQINLAMARHGAVLLADGDTIIHHCNTGALAAVDWGTALGVIRMAHDQGKHIHVLVDETRPRLQGSRLTAWELDQYGIPYEIICDNMAGHFLQSGEVQKVVFGADRVAANGDVANKIGTYMLALAASDNRVPVYAVIPTSTVDMTTATGAQIPIEERDPGEVLDIDFRGTGASPQGARARNPAFDVTPHRLISAVVTERGIAYPPLDINLTKLMSP